MALTAKLFASSFSKAFNKEIDFDTDTVKVMLCTSSYVPNQGTHVYKSSVTNEVAGTGYTARGAALTTKTNTVNGATLTTKLDADDTSWAASTITARIAVVYVDTTVDATSALIGYVDFGQDISSSASTFSIIWDANGIATLTVS